MISYLIWMMDSPTGGRNAPCQSTVALTSAPLLKYPQPRQPYGTLRACLVLCPRFLLRTFAIMALRLEGGDGDGGERQKRGA